MAESLAFIAESDSSLFAKPSNFCIYSSNDSISVNGSTNNQETNKDMYNEKYWKAKENNMMYNNYGRRYEPYGNDYNRRGVDEKYRGNDYIDGMYNGYNRYEEGRRDYNRGNYNAKDDTLNSLRYMLESAMQFINMLKSEANSQEEMQMIREYTKRISEM